MASDSTTSTKALIEKLSDCSYDSWSCRMMLLLAKEDLWDAAQGESKPPGSAPDDIKERCRKKEMKALAIIGLRIGDVILPHIADAKEPCDLWIKLEELCAQQAQAHRAHLRRQLSRMRMSDGETASELLMRAQGIVSRLAKAGHAAGDDAQACAALNALPKKFDAVAAILEAKEELSLTSIAGSLLKEESKLKESDEGIGSPEEGESAFQAREARKRYCCKRKGRLKKNCAKLAKDAKDGKIKNANGGRPEKAQAAFASVRHDGLGRKRWIVGSGASSRMACHRDAAVNLRKTSKRDAAQMGDGRKAKVEGIGRASLDAAASGEKSRIELRDALYAPSLAASLISIAKAASGKLKVTFNEGNCAIKTKDGRAVAKAARVNSLRSLIGKPIVERHHDEAAFYAKEREKADHKLWHRRLGHLNYRDLELLIKKNMVNGLALEAAPKETEACAPCVTGKSHRQPINKKGSSAAGEILELARSDLCGPIKPPTIGSARRALAVADDCSRASWAMLLKKKSDVKLELQVWIKLAESQTGKKVKRLRSDRGGERLNEVLSRHFERKGINHEKSVAHTPWQNGVAERISRALFDKARSMMSHMKAKSKKLWAEAVAAANYLRSRSPAKMLADCAPHEKLTNKRPNADHLKTFGCDACMHAQKERRSGKLGDRALPGVMMGYAADSKACRAWDVKNKDIKITRDAVFDESSALFVDDQEEVVISGVDSADDEAPGEGIAWEPESRSAEVAPEEAQNESADSRAPEEPRYPRRNRAQAQLHTPGESFAGAACAEPKTHSEALEAPDQSLWKEAISDEMKSLIENGAWELCKLPEGRKPIAAKWAFKLKRNESGEVARHKARLAAKGFTQRPGIDFDQAFAPVTRHAALRMLLGIAAAKDLEIMQVGIKAAFLNGKLEEEAHMDQPEGFIRDANLACKLKRAICGLKQAPRAWRSCLKKHSEKLNFAQSIADPGLYRKLTSSGSICIVVYVDDLLIFGSDKESASAAQEELKNAFDARDLGNVKHFLGIEIARDRKNKAIKIAQELYIKDLLKRLRMENFHPNKAPMSTGLRLSKGMRPSANEEQEVMAQAPHQSLIGALMHLANCARPDISCAVGVLARCMSNPGDKHWTAAKGVLRHLKGAIKKGIVFFEPVALKRIATLIMLEILTLGDLLPGACSKLLAEHFLGGVECNPRLHALLLKQNACPQQML